jgi:hypothetical protein
MTTLSDIITPTNLVTATSTTTLTNKTIAYGSNTLTDVVGVSATQTLTNKTLTAPTIASANLTTALTLAGAAGSNGQVLTSAGSGLPSWTTISSSPTIVRSARTSNTILGTADASTLIAITSGTFTQTFTAAATLGSGWFCYIQNSGTGVITLDPNSSETIDGLTSYAMYPNEVRLVQCTGTAFFSLVLSPFLATFTSSGTFVKPPGYAYFGAKLFGGGGGGQNFNTLLASSFSATETITVGAGGTGGVGGSPSNFTYDGTPGVVGGTSSIATYLIAYGGGRGGAGTGAETRGGGGGGSMSSGTNGQGGLPTLVVPNSAVTDGIRVTGSATNNYGSVAMGFGGGGSCTVTKTNENKDGTGGSSEYGGSAGGGGDNGNGDRAYSGAKSTGGATGGGSGGTIDASNNTYAAGAGGGVGFVLTVTGQGGGAAGGSGAAGTAGSVLSTGAGGGGGGGGFNSSGTAFAGGAGATPGGGGGGGGGGSGALGFGGAGAVGGNGIVYIWGIA